MPTKKPARQTLTGIIRSRVPSYQARQLAGELQKTFAQEMTDEGHTINYADFRTLYARARKQLTNVGVPKIPKILPESNSDADAETETSSPRPDAASDNDTSHRPTDLDSIIQSVPNLRDLAKLSKRKPQ